MNEAQGRKVLLSTFQSAGYAIVENVDLDVDGHTVNLDGYDSARRVGYEFITDEAGDREEFTPQVCLALEAKMRRGELYVFLMDEANVPSDAALADAARRFLAAVSKVHHGG